MAAFTFEVQLRWSDEDRLGHINNTRYLTFAEDARLAWFEGMPSRQIRAASGSVILARVECDFIAQGRAPMGARVSVANTVERIGRSSLDLRQLITDAEGTTIASVKAVLVGFDYDAAVALPWSDEQRSWMATFQAT